MTDQTAPTSSDWHTLVRDWVGRFAEQAQVPMEVLLSGRRASPRVSRFRYVCAARLRDELGLTYSQIADLFQVADRSTARDWTLRGRLPDPATRPPGVPNTEQLALRFE